jgi:glycine betaine/proline transport system substrate-binding protein
MGGAPRFQGSHTRSRAVAWRSPRTRFVRVARLALAVNVVLPLAAEVAVANGAADRRDDPACGTVRLADVGWTDVAATTALLSRLLQDLGYRPQTTILSVPVAFASMRHKDIDVFLGNWMPAQRSDLGPYVAEGSIEVIGANLIGAKYTLAVPVYSYQSGLRSFADIARFGAALGNVIYGIEPGNNGNRLILTMLQQNAFGLGAFRLIESSEQAMLAEVERAYRARAPIVFLAWDPHPMNLRFDLRYLSGGDAIFGPNFGGATVYTVTRAGYSRLCPNVGRLLENLKFTLVGESQVMAAMLERHEQPSGAAAAWLQGNSRTRAAWLEGVNMLDGRPALASPGAADGNPRTFEALVTRHKLPVGDVMTLLVEYLKSHGNLVIAGIANLVRGSVTGLNAVLRTIPAPLLLAGLVALTWVLRRSVATTVFVAVALLFIMNQGYWSASLETLSLVLVAAATSTLIGVPLGIAGAHRPRFYALLRPVLDLMQTLPTFVYLIPTLVVFGLGVVPGLISTVVFALPAPVRLAQLGVSSVPRPLIEAGEAFGATRMQILWKIELPAATASILAGITQCIMLSLSMVVIAALVGAGGLGVPVVRALNTVQVGMGFEAGLVIVLLAIVLDRLSRPQSADPRR